MKKIKLAACIQASIQYLDQMINANEESILIDDEAQLLSQIHQFFCSAAVRKKDNDEDIDFNEFVIASNLYILQSAIEETPLAKFCRDWLENSAHNQYTFMVTNIRQVPLKNLIYLDGFYEDINEILAWMNSCAKYGINIFINPTKKILFTQDAINTLKRYPGTSDFIQQKEFYDALHEYLMKLYKIGKENPLSIWSFPESKLEAYRIAKENFFKNIDSIFTPEKKETLSKTKIIVPYKGTAPVEVTFNLVFDEKNESKYIVIQQIILWFMLVKQRPYINIPFEIINSNDGSLFEFERLPTKKRRQHALMAGFFDPVRMIFDQAMAESRLALMQEKQSFSFLAG